MIVYEGVCEFCGSQFRHEYNEKGTLPKNQPRFCSKQHRKAGHQKPAPAPYDEVKNNEYVEQTYRQKKLKSDHTEQKVQEPEFDFRCPTPYKQSFITVEIAKEYIRLVHPEEKNFSPYICKCGSIHIGHSSPAIPRPKDQQKVTVVMDRDWCAYSNKPGFLTEEDAYSWCEDRLLPEHVTPFICTCGYIHLHISPEGRAYRKASWKKRAASQHPLLKDHDKDQRSL